MSEAVRRLLNECHALLVDPLFQHKFKYCTAPRLRNAIAAVEAELNAVPAVTDKQGFDGRSTDYPDYVENYR